jgi:tRNA A-37 threonylcarbamoyl transferase component Bud32
MRHWGKAVILDTADPLGDKYISLFSDWSQFWKAGSPELFKASPNTDLYWWRCDGMPELALKIYHERIPLPRWWPYFYGRVKRAWRTGVLLYEMDIPVPSPVALIRHKKGAMVVIMERIHATHFMDMLRRGAIGKEEFRLAGRLTANMHKGGVAHGDLKWVNLMVSCPGTDHVSGCPLLFFVDFDGSMIFGRGLLKKFSFNRARAKDVARFIFAAMEEGVDPVLIKGFWQGYVGNIHIHSGFIDLLKYHWNRLIRKRDNADLNTGYLDKIVKL